MTSTINRYQTFLRDKLIHIFHRYSLPRWFVFSFDNLAVFVLFLLAYFLRFNFTVNDFIIRHALFHALIVLIIYVVFSFIFRSYSGIIRHTTLTDITLVFAVTTLSTAFLLLLSLLSRLFKWNPVLTVPFSIILIHFGLITVFLFFVRISIKILFRFATGSLKKTKNVLIYGAGDLGFTVKRIILSDPRNDLNVLGFIDDNRKLWGKKVNDIPVYGPEVLNQDFLSEKHIRNLVIAIRNISPERKGKIISRALDSGLETLTIPSVEKMLMEKPGIHHFQKVRLEDLLGSEPNKPDEKLLGKELNGKIVLVTGAAGSIGSEIVRQLIRFSPAHIIFLDQAETPMSQIENELKRGGDNIRKTFIIGDVTKSEKIDQIFNKYRPEIVYHSAAYKHVPIMEENPHEAFEVNIIGTKIIAEMSVKYGVERFILISTDKCKDPSGAMSASRCVSEMLINSIKKEEGVVTRFMIIRFGNVLGSGGSVVPIFTQQIADGGPVTVTHPEISRYFMTIPEACELILEAGFLGQGDEIFSFDMGKPVRIADMAVKMIRLSGYEPGKDIEIKFTGLRPGEKLNDEEPDKNVVTIATQNPKIKILKPEDKNHPGILSEIDIVYKNLYKYKTDEIIKIMFEIIKTNS
ncbi:MAG TPA: nucleoside-diphosphate sugar epimerase/dehydratase [Bacteroidales bacterium]|nr:nucleoside-diphosphate sugar epimerase/dehydratase [Bacteroidales bacterium]HQK68428.1 nucleoside-diphosphate sugar epimerase/dehydratase [Bacteroidales bacterium]